MFLLFFFASFLSFCIDFSPNFPRCTQFVEFVIFHLIWFSTWFCIMSSFRFQCTTCTFDISMEMISFRLVCHKCKQDNDTQRMQEVPNFHFLFILAALLRWWHLQNDMLCVCLWVSANKFRMWIRVLLHFCLLAFQNFRLHLMAQDDFVVQWWDSLIWKYFRIGTDGSTITHTRWLLVMVGCHGDDFVTRSNRIDVFAFCVCKCKMLRTNICVWNFRNCGYCYGCLVLILLDLKDIRWSSKQTSAIVIRPNEKSTQNPNNAAIILWYALVRSHFIIILCHNVVHVCVRRCSVCL